MLVSAWVGGCAYNSLRSIDEHFQTYKARMPEGDNVFVCSAYGCRTQTKYRFTSADVATLQSMMSAAHASTPADERQAARLTLAWMEKRVGDVVGTSADRIGDDFGGSGDPTQMDCVDIATNLSSYLLILERHGLLRHHSVGAVFAKEDLRRGIQGWLHYAAILVEKGSDQRFAVDGWQLASGTPPEIVETQKWYIDDSEIVFGKTNGPEPR
jgi:hypothetical protein